jgi:hypothetical protein
MDASHAETTPSEDLAEFLANNPGARRVGQSLNGGAEVAVRFVDQPGDWRIHIPESGTIHFEAVKAADPDFELYLPTAAVESLKKHANADISDLGIAFFEHIVAKEPARKIGVRIHSGVVKLTRRGWLGVLALGGPKVVMWMAGKGLISRGAIASALSRFKS